MNNSSKPTPKPFTFSIKSLLVVTVAVAVCLGFCRMFPNSVLLLIWPVVVAPLLIFSRRTILMVCFPLTTLIGAVLIAAILDPYGYNYAPWIITALSCVVAIVEIAIRNTRKKNAETSSRAELSNLIFVESAIAGALVGLAFAGALLLVGLLLLPFYPGVGVVTLIYGSFACVILPILVGCIGFAVGLLLSVVYPILAHQESVAPVASRDKASNN